MSTIFPSPPTPDRITSWSLRMVNSVLQRYSIDQASWEYEQGLIVHAIAQVGRISGDLQLTGFAQHWVDQFVQDDGTIRTYHVEEYNLDRVNPGRNLFLLYKATGLERYKKALDMIYSQLENQPRNQAGGFWHKKIYPHQMWLDGIYMAEPFYAEYAATFNHPALFDDIIHQITLCGEHTRDPITGLFYHGWDASRAAAWAAPQTGCSSSFWGRAMGWYAMAIVDVLDFLPLDYPGRAKIISILQQLAEALLSYQDAGTGMWYQVIDAIGKPGNYGESSATAMLAYSFAKAARNGWLNGEVMLSARRAYRGLLENQIKVDAQGRLTLQNICAVAGLGGNPNRDGSYEYYVSESVVSDDFKGVGAFILAALEMESADLLIPSGDPSW